MSFTVGEALSWAEQLVSEKESSGGGAGIRGEFVVVLGPKLQDEAREAASDGAALEGILLELQKDGVRRSEAVRMAVDLLGLPKSKVYKAALAMSGWEKGEGEKKLFKRRKKGQEQEEME
jgi:16S rRNA C1402 (ribose-2'-O) methylase RsmI|tara:strand:- start:77 stop:436 length:360 start_codon:yes stop_codon:yes gene_type:complete